MSQFCLSLLLGNYHDKLLLIENSINGKVILMRSHVSLQIRKRLLEFMLSAFQRSPDFIALLKACPFFPFIFFSLKIFVALFLVKK